MPCQAGPMVGSRSMINTTPITAEVVSTGRKNMVRKKVLPLHRFQFRSRARRSERKKRAGTTISRNLPVTLMLFKNCLSSNRAA